VTKITRRAAIVRGAALASAGAVASVPALAQANAPDPIFSVIKERKRLYAVFQQASNRAEAISATLPAEALGLPRISDDLSKADRHDLILLGGAKFNKTGHGDAPNTIEGFWTVDRKCVEKINNPSLLAWWDEEMARKQRARDESGLTAANEAAEAAWDAYVEADSRVATTQATTLAGLIAKLRIVAQSIRDDSLEDDLMPSVITDAERLIGARV
jgi:hypothetical protein